MSPESLGSRETGGPLRLAPLTVPGLGTVFTHEALLTRHGTEAASAARPEIS